MNLKHRLKLDKFYSIKARVEKAIAKPVDTVSYDFDSTYPHFPDDKELDLYQHGVAKTGNILSLYESQVGQIARLSCGHDISLGHFQKTYNIGDHLNCPVCANIAGEGRLQNGD